MAWNARHVWIPGEITTSANLNNNDSNWDETWHDIETITITAPVVATGTTEATATTMIGGTAKTYRATPVRLEVYVPACGGTGGTSSHSMTGLFTRDTTVLGTWELMFRQYYSGIGDASLRYQTWMVFTETPTAGIHTYRFKAYSTTGAESVTAGPGGPGQFVPGFMRVMQKG